MQEYDKAPGLHQLHLKERFAQAVPVIGMVAVGFLAAPPASAAAVRQSSQPQQPLERVHIGTAVKGFVDPKTGERGALCSARPVR